MFKIGVVNIDVSHPLVFSDILHSGNRARYFAVYNDGFRGDDEVEGFIRNCGLDRRCNTVEELADCCDIGFIQGVNWDKHLDYAEVFIKKGKPVFIDKPIVGNIADCARLEELAAEGGVILGASSLRYAKEVCDFLALPLEERGEVINVFGTCGNDEFNYGIHVVETIGAIVGGGAQSVTFSGRASRPDTTCETFTVTFEGGITATYHTITNIWLPCHFLVTTTKGVFNINVDAGKAYHDLLDRICEYMETGLQTTATVPLLLESIKILLAGRISRENGGGAVRLCDIPSDDSGYDGSAFERKYATLAKKIYL